jgi:prevent-host-death family protein
VRSRTLSATEVARNFADVVNRVRYRGEEFMIEKGGEPVARLSPVSAVQPTGTVGDLLRLAEKLGTDPAFADELDEIIRQDNQPLGLPNPWEP